MPEFSYLKANVIHQNILWCLSGLALMLLPYFTYSQNRNYAKEIANLLCQPECFGRGYVKNGDAVAAELIKKEWSKTGLKPWGKYEQAFGFPVIRFAELPTCSIGERPLTEGHDFVPDPGCPKIEGTWPLFFLDSATVDNVAKWNQFLKKKRYGKMLVLDLPALTKVEHPERIQQLQQEGGKFRGIILLQEKITWGVSSSFERIPKIYIRKAVFPKFGETVTLYINPEFVPSYQTKNLLGYIPGTKFPDSFVVFTAHYDHLGGIGKEVFFPGANDNASGVALLLDLAHYYAKNPLPYSVAFFLFAGEEAGLMGSLYYVTHPIFPLSQISLLMNIDLAGTGEKGATFVNGSVFKEIFDTLVSLNATWGCLPAGIFPRGKAANSDHYFFSEKGVPSLFMYLMGDYPYYHDTRDMPEKLTWNGYDGTFWLLQKLMEWRTHLK